MVARSSTKRRRGAENGVRLPEGQEVTVLGPYRADQPAAGRLAATQHPGHSACPRGPVLRPLTADDDLLGEMLEDRA